MQRTWISKALAPKPTPAEYSFFRWTEMVVTLLSSAQVSLGSDRMIDVMDKHFQQELI
jgi:hypothetical protein